MRKRIKVTRKAAFDALGIASNKVESSRHAAEMSMIEAGYVI